MEEQRENSVQAQQHNAVTTIVNQSITVAVSTPSSSRDDDARWWEVENDDLILDLVPNVETHSESENTNNNALSDDFASFSKHGVNVNASLITNNNQIDSNADNENGECTRSILSSSTNKKGDDRNVKSFSSRESENNAFHLPDSDVPPPSNASKREQTLEEFKEELRIKRLARQTAVQDLRDEIATLRKQLADEQMLTRQLRHNVNVSMKGVDVGTVVDGEDGAIGGAIVEPDSDDEDHKSCGRHANIELANAQLALQMANSENLSLRTELGVVQKQVGTLKEVIACCKQMLTIKEEQCVQLKNKLDEIETTFAERELKIMSSNLRQEYERQLGNIRQLRQLYEERQRIALAEQENLQRLISIKRDELLAEQQKTKNYEEHSQTLMKEIENANNELATLREECNEHKFEKKAIKEEMGAVNMLFSQMVMGFNGENNLDIDRLTMMLEENRGLLNDMATKEVNCTDGATLPKLLFELVEQAAVSGRTEESSRSPTPTPIVSIIKGDEKVEGDLPDRVVDVGMAAGQCPETTETSNLAKAEPEATAIHCSNTNSKSIKDASTATTVVPSGRKLHRKIAGNRMKLTATAATADSAATVSPTLKIREPEVMSKVATTQEIIGNLPKVWKVLMELLSHHKIERVQFEEHGASEDCYKSVETATGTQAELSVSKTYIKLKDLILEKKSLMKETNRLKTLNCHLEYRLNEQEKRLSAVSLELTKTWHLVGKMQRQHRQLHTQEQILRYQLQQKRRLLSELKDELEYCRRKWAAARAKNDESQEQCNDLRREFALRKLEHANNSAESGYSDSGQVSDEELGATAPRDVASEVDASVAGDGVTGGVSSATAAFRRKRVKEMFEHARKIKRMQSTSPGRAGASGAEIVLRWNSAPPTCGWHRGCGGNSGADDDDGHDDISVGGADGQSTDVADLTATRVASNGAIPKGDKARNIHRSRREAAHQTMAVNMVGADGSRGEHTGRIQRLEEQCKSLIQQVIETSDNRERLEVQLRSFEDEIAPVQYAVPLNDFINKKRIERMTRASSVPITGTLTPREEEYTRKRSERLERLEEESRQLLSRIKRTADRGHYLRCSLDRLRRAPSREDSLESNTEEELSKVEENPEVKVATVVLQRDKQMEEAKTEAQNSTKMEEPKAALQRSPLTANEEDYTAHRSARLQRLESESRQLLNKLSRNTERGQNLGDKLDVLHERHSDIQLTEMESTSAAAQGTGSRLIRHDSIERRLGDIEQISSNRTERLRILEEEGKELINRLAETSARGTEMINRIAARELNRQIATAKASEHQTSNIADPPNTTDNVVDTEDEGAAGIVATTVDALMPTLNTVACTSIVCEELNDRVTVTTVPSRIAAQQGAIPKQPRTKSALNAAIRAEAANRKELKQSHQGTGETLEDMVRRLREIPFPEQQHQVEKGDRARPEQVTDVEEKVPDEEWANKSDISE